jgi:hypothetical protein
MATRRISWKPPCWLAAVAVILAASVACSRDDSDESSRQSPQASTAGRDANSATTAEAGASSTMTSTTTVTPSTTPVPATGSAGPEDCAEVQAWGTEPQDAAPMSTDELYLVRAGQHDCFDRVVFDVNGTIDGPETIGYSVAYISGEVQADGSGGLVPTAGAAALRVVIRAPSQGYGTSGHQPWRPPAQVGDDFFTPGQLRSWGSLREISFAGSFEGLSTIAVGVEAKLPFRVGSDDQGGYTHVYLDVAHPR